MFKRGGLKTRELVLQFSRSFSSTQKVVSVDYKIIQEGDKALFDKFEEAYGDDGLGIMAIENVPGYPEKRELLLPLAQRLAQLPEDDLKSLEAPEYFHSVGWSHGREKFMGLPDLLKASFYANPCFDAYESSQQDEYGDKKIFYNKWPEDEMPELKIAFNE